MSPSKSVLPLEARTSKSLEIRVAVLRKTKCTSRSLGRMVSIATPAPTPWFLNLPILIEKEKHHTMLFNLKSHSVLDFGISCFQHDSSRLVLHYSKKLGDMR